MLKRFVLYAAAFEEAYSTRDFSVLVPFFTDDAIYEIQRPEASPLLISGRDRVFEYMAWITENFDLRFARRQILRVDGPNLLEDAVSVHGVAVYTLDNGERCHLSMGETAHFRGDRIARLVDQLSPGGFYEMSWIVDRYPDRFPADILSIPASLGA